MRAPWVTSFFFFLFLIFSSNTALDSWYHPPKPSYDRISGPSSTYNYTIINYPSVPRHPLPTAYLSTTWINDESSIPSINFTDGSRVRLILEQDRFVCGFFCNGNCISYLFSILIRLSSSQDHPFGEYGNPEVVWSANRDYPVRDGAILNLTAAGELVLQDVDGSIVWTTNTTMKSVATMKLYANGNLGLFDVRNSTVWQSFDHPTDCLVQGQKLLQGQKLIPSVSSTNWTAQKDAYYLEVNDKGLFAYVESDPPQVYYKHLVNSTHKEGIYVELLNGNLCFLNSSTKLLHGEPNCSDAIPISQEFPPHYIKLMPDGHLQAIRGETIVNLLYDYDFGDCSYPLACGRNAICSHDVQCSCPYSSNSHGTEYYFKAIDDSQPNKGCSRVTALTCNAPQEHYFIEIKNVKYFTYTADKKNVDMETCKQACLNNCSCKAAIFSYLQGSNSSRGSCDLPSDLFTMTSVDTGLLRYNASAFIKVQNTRSKKKHKVAAILGSTIGGFVLLLIMVVGCTKLKLQKQLLIMVVGCTKLKLQKQKMNNEMEEEYFDQVPGLPTRFSYEQLKTATENFTKKLGEGGFGSVFEGTLEDGSKIAVKCLEGLVHVKKSFQAEVGSVGSIHHVILVRLTGFCVRKSDRLLVYEFMNNGSLDRWIYNGDRKNVLSWECRKKIILDIAKGLAYLHEDCRQKIIHLDIKPQNILLDEDFNAKISDFGLSKLIEKDQSQVITIIGGTPGYMAPECGELIITEKLDVYSFGIVLLEIICGRKNVDRSQPEESWHLLRVFQRCWEEDTLLDIVDRYSEDMQVHGAQAEIMVMMKLAAWSLQAEFTKRPSMSSVVKVLEGVMDVESRLDYRFLHSRPQEIILEHLKSSKMPSILSGPR